MAENNSKKIDRRSYWIGIATGIAGTAIVALGIDTARQNTYDLEREHFAETHLSINKPDTVKLAIANGDATEDSILQEMWTKADKHAESAIGEGAMRRAQVLFDNLCETTKPKYLPKGTQCGAIGYVDPEA